MGALGISCTLVSGPSCLEHGNEIKKGDERHGVAHLPLCLHIWAHICPHFCTSAHRTPPECRALGVWGLPPSTPRILQLLSHCTPHTPAVPGADKVSPKCPVTNPGWVRGPPAPPDPAEPPGGAAARRDPADAIPAGRGHVGGGRGLAGTLIGCGDAKWAGQRGTALPLPFPAGGKGLGGGAAILC